MAKKDWAFQLDGREHSLHFEQGFSGKKKIQIDGEMAYESTGLMDTKTEFPFEIEGHLIVLLIKSGLIDSYDLFVDDRSLETGRVGPARITVNEIAEGLEIVYKGGRAAFGFVLLIALAVTGFSTFFMLSTLTSGPLTLADMMYMPLVFLLVGLGLMYWSLVKTFNKTVLTIDPLEVSVKHVPIPWFGQRTLQVADMKRLYCESYERRSNSPSGDGGFSVSVSMTFILYRICAQLSNDKKIILLSDLDKCYEAQFVNRQLTRRLGKLVQSDLQTA